jgi:hypothetical protein
MPLVFGLPTVFDDKCTISLFQYKPYHRVGKDTRASDTWVGSRDGMGPKLARSTHSMSTDDGKHAHHY